MLFVTYLVEIGRLREIVPAEFELDTPLLDGHRSYGCVSAVAFKVAEVRSNILKGVSFNQVNHRAYVKSEEGPAVVFLDYQVSSRMVAASATMLNLPVSYEPIEIATEPAQRAGNGFRCRITSAKATGLQAEADVDGKGSPGAMIPSEFITERPVGFVSTSSGRSFKLVVEHDKLSAIPARAQRVAAPLFESLGILNEGAASSPHSVLYVAEAVFKANPPTPLSS